MPKIPDDASKDNNSDSGTLPGYRNWAETRGHAYGEVVSNIPYNERILSENRSETIERELERFFVEEQNKNGSEAEKLAIRVLEEANEESYQIIKEAEAKGYLPDFHLHEPWHPKPFLNGEIVTYPYQHDSVILYTGISKHFFFHEDSDKNWERSRVQQSILEIGEIPAVDDPSAGKGNFFGFLKVAKQHSSKSKVGGAVLEVQIPSEKLTTIFGQLGFYKNLTELREKEGKAKYMDQNSQYDGLTALREDLGTPEGFREKCLETDLEKVHFKINGSIPLEWIKGVWDTENSEKPIFVSLEDFVKTLKSQYGDHVSGRSDIKPEKAREEILNEINSYKNVYKDIENLRKSLETIQRHLEYESKSGRLAGPAGDLEEELKNYDNSLSKLRKDLERKFQVNVGKPKSVKVNEIKKESKAIKNQIKEVESGLKEAVADEQQHAQKTNWDKQKFKQEKFLEKRLEKNLADMIIKIPFIED